jgi:predicted enzyme related to lactoylglutathione lyase
MFKSLKRITYHASDIAEAKKWYASVLNIQPMLDTPFVIIFRVGDCSLSISKAINPIHADSEQVEVFWEVEDIDSSFQKLVSLGAKQFTPITNVLNIRTAKVIDPFGNIIGITDSPLDAKKRSVENKPSESAALLAFCRALAAKDEREEIKGSDYLRNYF